MFCQHDKHELYEFVKGKENLFAVVISDDSDEGGYISEKWSHSHTPGDYAALALGLVFDNRYDAEQKLKELVEQGKLKEKEIIKFRAK